MNAARAAALVASASGAVASMLAVSKPQFTTYEALRSMVSEAEDPVPSRTDFLLVKRWKHDGGPPHHNPERAILGRYPTPQNALYGAVEMKLVGEHRASSEAIERMTTIMAMREHWTYLFTTDDGYPAFEVWRVSKSSET